MLLVEKTVAVLIALACIVMLVRLMVGPQRRLRWDRLARQWWASAQSTWMGLYRWRASRKEAEKATQDILLKLRQRAERDGNVIRPKAFKHDKEDER